MSPGSTDTAVPPPRPVLKLVSNLSQAALRGLSMLDRKFNDSSLYGMTLADPYTVLTSLQARGRILRSYTYQGWLVTGFEEARSLMHHECMTSDLRNNRFMTMLARSAVGGERVVTIDDPTMLNLDPPDHTRLRRLVSHGFTLKFVRSLEPKIQRVCADLLDEVADKAQFDLISHLARPLPAIVIADMLGVPDGDHQRFQAWSAELLSLTKIARPDLMRRAARATVEMEAYFADLVAAKRNQPGDDLISTLIEVEEAGDRLSAKELYSLCILLLVAGHETTTRLIGNGMLLLMQHPVQLEMLRKSPALMDNAIEEMLRMEPPVQFFPRLVKESFRFQDCYLRKGQAVLVSIAAANRDPLANEAPGEFDITRQEVRHIAFGHGPHLCLGMALARLEARTVLTMLLNRYDRIHMVDPVPRWGSDFFFRGLDSLDVQVA